MNKRILIKILATILVLMLTFSNVILIGVYAVTEGIESQQASVNHTRMEFDAYFKPEDRKVHSATFDINSQDIKLYLSFKVTEGNLNNGSVSLSESNFKFKEYKDEQGIIQSIDLQNNIIYLNSINRGTDIVIEIPIEIKKGNVIDADYFSKESRATLSGEYINNNGDKVEAQKEIKLCMRLHGEINAALEQTFDKYVPFNTNTLKGTLLQSTVKAGVENNILPIKQAVTTIEVPVINSVKPTSVVVVGKEYSYNNQTGILTINYNNIVENNEVKWNRNGLETYKIIYIYGQEAYTNSSVTIEQKARTEISVYNDIEMNASKNIEETKFLDSQISDNISNTVSMNTQELYKGFLYNNSQNETEYTTIWKADIGYTNLANEVTFVDDGDKYVTYIEQEAVEVPNYVYYKSTYIAKDNFEHILGQDGYIDIYDEHENKIGTINKDTMLDENDYYIFNYGIQTNKITIKTSKPINEIMGEELIVYNNKALKNTNEYSLEQLKDFNAIKTTLNIEKSYIELKENETRIEAAVNKNTISTAATNNVDFTISLVTDSPKYELFKNPVVDIKLPNYVENIELGNVDILFANGEISVASKQILQDNEGNKIIRVVLSGEQTDYTLNSTTKGANLFVNANITTNRFMASQQSDIEVTCTNAKNNTQVATNIKMNFESEPGALMANSISNYNGSSTVTSLKGNTSVGNLEMNATSKIATIDLTLINNENIDIPSAVILGRIPFEGNKTVLTNKELGSNFTAKLQSVIQANGVNATVYYSDNGLANTDLQNSENRWSTTATTDANSYLIVLNETFKKGQTINFKYNVEIPENLGTDKVAYSNYAIFYNNQGYDAPVVGMATDFVMLTQYREQMQDENGNVIIDSNQTIKGEDLVNAELNYYLEEGLENKIGVGDIFNYLITIKNNTYSTLDNINILDILPSNLEYMDSSIISNQDLEDISCGLPSYNSDNHNIQLNIGSLPAQESIKLKIQVRANRYVQSGIVNQCIITGNEIYLVEQNNIQMKSPAVINAVMSGSILKDNIEEKTDLRYTITVNNEGGDNANVKITSSIPEGVIVKNAKCFIDAIENVINIENNELDLSDVIILKGKAVKIEIEAEVEELPEDIRERELETFALITGTDINVKTNTVKYVVKKNSDQEFDSIKKSISGLVWNDENKNGKKDSIETGIANVKVKLINSNGKVIVQSTTDSSGNYRLSDLDKGTYIVMFEYDSKLYSVTTYKKDDVIETLNSDAKETTYERNKVAMTDNIEINSSSKTNINLGLVKNSLFDLKLDKYINSITVQSDQGTTTYSYTDTNFAKVEIASKYLSSATVIIEYKIVVTNEGDIAGYTKQIVDYIPQDLKFSSELNKQWHVNTDGNLYTTSLADMIINPGETKEVNLIVTKKITENNTGLITNQAEIAESYNEQGIKEYDSVAANKNQNEDDMSTANIIIGVKTGGVALYITITLVCIVVLAGGSYIINKKVLRGIK